MSENENKEVQTQQEETKTVPAVRAVVEAKETGELVPKTLEGQFRLANMYDKSKMFPKQFDTPEKIMVGLQLCYELGVKPVTGLRNVYVLNGIPNLFGDLPLAIVRRSGLIKQFKETFYDKDGVEISPKNIKPVFSAVCFAERINGDSVEEFFTMDDAKNAGLTSSVWQKYSKDMLRYRARARTLKSLFPDVLQGIAIAEYDAGIKPDVMSDEELNTEAKILSAQHIQTNHTPVETLKEKCRQANGTLFTEEEKAQITKEEAQTNG